MQATPNSCDRPPKSPREIAKRLEQIQFNATLNCELEALKTGVIVGATPKLRRLRIGRISAQDEFAGLADESAENLGWAFLQRLRAGSRAAVEAFRRRTRARAQRRR